MVCEEEPILVEHLVYQVVALVELCKALVEICKVCVVETIAEEHLVFFSNVEEDGVVEVTLSYLVLFGVSCFETSQNSLLDGSCLFYLAFVQDPYFYMGYV